jgi:beta-glucosidase
MTLNEPQVFCFAGHGIGNHAPGIPLPLAEQLRVVHHVLMAHGRAVQVLRAECPETPQVGWAPVGITKYPEDPSQPEQVEAARADMFAVTGENLWTGAWYSDPVIRGAYPEDGLRQWSAQMPKIESGDMELMAQPLDFYGVNIYHGQPVRLNPETGQTEPVKRGPGFPETHIGWPVAPESLYWGPRFLHERYGLPVYLTENGLSSHDWVALDGRVHDQPRIDFLRRYLLQLERAINDGVDIRGYFQWSILDNFEWAEGYHHRFGLIHVDYETQQRTLKDSAHWYADVIATNGASLRRDAYAQP